jgi:hypothetical protein
MPTVIKASFLLGISAQGISESLISADPNATYLSVQTKMAAIQSARGNLSVTGAPAGNLIGGGGGGGNVMIGAPAAQNLLTTTAIRLSDELLARDVLAYGSAFNSTWIHDADNFIGNLVVKVIWRNAAGQQIAVSYIHGVPPHALIGVLPSDMVRVPSFNKQWELALSNYCSVIQASNMGFPVLNLTPPNALGPITAVVYNAVTGYWQITTTNAAPTGRFRVRLAQFKSLRQLNGRQSAQGNGTNTFSILRKLPTGVWDSTGTAVPLSGYNNGVLFWNYTVVPPTSASPTLLTTHKLGRPFFLQRGRVSRRAA